MDDDDDDKIIIIRYIPVMQRTVPPSKSHPDFPFLIKKWKM